jgi:2-alkyl-3-oxoalkanoate reductase
MRILVTGASGFVGGAFMRRFAGRSDLELHGVSRRPSDLPNYTSRDLSQPFDLPLPPDVVIHAAARASPWGTRREFERQNVETTRQVIAYCIRHAVPRLVYVSSSSVFYRFASQLGITEQSPIGPAFVNDYAATKFAGEQLVSAYPGEHVIVRPRAVFGPGDTVLFPRILAAARARRLPLFTGQKESVIGDLIYIDALSDYLLAAATGPLRAPAYNLTNNQPVVLQDLLLRVLGELGIQGPARKMDVGRALRAAALLEGVYRLFRIRAEPPITRFGMSMFAHSKTFDVRLALRDLGAPSVALDEGISQFVAWQRAQWGA